MGGQGAASSAPSTLGCLRFWAARGIHAEMTLPGTFSLLHLLPVLPLRWRPPDGQS